AGDPRGGGGARGGGPPAVPGRGLLVLARGVRGHPADPAGGARRPPRGGGGGPGGRGGPAAAGGDRRGGGGGGGRRGRPAGGGPWPVPRPRRGWSKAVRGSCGNWRGQSSGRARS